MNAFLPVVPEYVTVHLGAPSSNAENVTVTFSDYIKNVASSEIYPTWPEAALRANIYAQISFALNRIYTEYYRSRGYDFDITNNPAYDQAFVAGRDVFENISEIVDGIFNSYIRREGFVEPLYAIYCNGTTTTCDGLSQWGSVELANRGFGAFDILTRYYGDNITLVENAPVAALEPSPPNVDLREGSVGNNVKFIQVRLNRISSNYPSIPKISETDGIFGAETRDAVREFQRIFSLDPTGVVDRSSWYRIQTIYNAVKRLNELESEGIVIDEVSNQFDTALYPGASGEEVRAVQYYLRTIGIFDPAISVVDITGVYDEATENAVREFQVLYGLPVTGEIDERTWDTMFDAYYGIIGSVSADQLGQGREPFPGVFLKLGAMGPDVLTLQKYINAAAVFYPRIPIIAEDGIFGTETRDAVYTAQAVFGFPVNGTVGPVLWDTLGILWEDVESDTRSVGQFGGILSYEGE